VFSRKDKVDGMGVIGEYPTSNRHKNVTACYTIDEKPTKLRHLSYWRTRNYVLFHICTARYAVCIQLTPWTR